MADNLDINLKESFGRVYTSIDDIEEAQNHTGCAVLKVSDQKLKDVVHSVDIIRDDIAGVKRRQSAYVDSSWFMWIIGAVVATNILFMIYTTQEMHSTDTKLQSHIVRFEESKESFKINIEDLKGK